MEDEQVIRLADALAIARDRLLAERTKAGHWEGELASSALSTATAVCALLTVLREQRKKPSGAFTENDKLASLATRGLIWLAANVNRDGGWGDTVRSFSNISTTTLCYAAFTLGRNSGLNFDKIGVFSEDKASCGQTESTLLPKAEAWLKERAGGMQPERLAAAIIQRYGKDRTFSVPILTLCAIAGLMGTGAEAWRHVIPLPFELAALPHRFYAALRLPVVSYALPALIAIGQARHHHAPSGNPLLRGLRHATRNRTLRKLESIQPSSGGFLEATPLTSFVAMSLAASGQCDHPVVRKAVQFLCQSVRPDGSWPIDSNLATWTTTLSINALCRGEKKALSQSERDDLAQWLLRQQYQQTHPYTQAPPGAWAWTDLSGGVPDADDTAGALIALHNLNSGEDVEMAVHSGVQWLLNLQNSDGGIPTFCRGWGALPFDRSGADLTAHALRAWTAWKDQLDGPLKRRVSKAIPRAVAYLARCQKSDGSWTPLWFGNQHEPREENPVYGTSRVVLALAECKGVAGVDALLDRGVQWLLSVQNGDGGWSGFKGGPNSTEETALALEALGTALECRVKAAHDNPIVQAVASGAAWLSTRVESGSWIEPSPIGFYFANLWYFEKLYPQIYTVAALSRAVDNGKLTMAPNAVRRAR